MALAHTKLPSIGYAAGLAAVYLGERVLEPGRASTTSTLLGLVIVAVALGLAIRQGRGRPAGRALPLLYGLGLLALAMHFSRATLPVLLGQRALAASLPRLDSVLAVLWPAVLFASALPVLLVEFALASMARSPVADARRVRAAMLSGFGVAFALVLCFALVFVATELGWKADLSFFRTASASAATKQLVAALDAPVEATLFYPPGNEVAEELADYFADLRRASARFSVARVDQAVDPAKAKALGVSNNGVVVIARGETREQMQIPLRLESARPKLRALDQDVYKRIVAVSRGKRTVYLVQGHEERSFTATANDNPQASLARLKDLLTMQNLEARDLGMAQGLGNEVPADAALVLLIGPERPMLAEETAALVRYFRSGGRLLVAADPENAAAATPLLAELSLEISPTPLANDRMYWARTHQKTDRTGIAAASYSSHAALATLAQFGARLPAVLLGAGALAKTKLAPTPGPKVDFVIRTEGSTWDDKNGNFEFDPDGEARKAYTVAAAVTLPKPADDKSNEPRAFVLGDADAFSDLVIANRANAILVLDALRWLLGEPEVAGPPASETDVPVRHTRKQNVFWFYSSVFAAPGLVLLAGWAVTRRRRRREVKP
ncbi:MAG: Gldg family protein [Deltaproteobacteria bacterium]|jgi:hypothetical protein|nr:Gldg family protein [Deltaproteobacteria bacterium]